jgi:hypothetical protein
MKTGLTIAALFVALASASASGVPPQVDDGPDRGVIAVLRRDGVLMPFAAFRGRSWTCSLARGASWARGSGQLGIGAE